MTEGPALPKLARFLDPRPLRGTSGAYEGAVRIPVEELRERQHELPPPDRVVSVVAEPELFEIARSALEETGRTCVRVPPDSVPEATATERLRLWEPNEFLVSVAGQLKPGKALDIACGSGRNSVALACMGWDVLAVDHLPDALKRLEDFAGRTLEPGEGRVRCEFANVEGENFAPDGRFDLICIVRFLWRPLFERVSDWLTPGGHLVVETFTEVHRERFGKPRTERFVLKAGELPSLVPDLEVRHYSEDWREGANTARLWATRGH